MINALITYSVFKTCGFTSKKDEDNLYKLVEGSYKKVLSNFFYAHKCIKNNHTLSEITGLIIGAWCCADNKNLERAYKLLNEEIEKQFSLMSDIYSIRLTTKGLPYSLWNLFKELVRKKQTYISLINVKALLKKQHLLDVSGAGCCREMSLIMEQMTEHDFPGDFL